MKFRILIPFFILSLFFLNTANCQEDFVTRIKIEFEKKINVHNNMQGEYAERMKDRTPKYDVTYYNFMYTSGRSLYRYDRELVSNQTQSYRRSRPDNVLYIDHGAKQTVAKRNVFEDDYIIKDSLRSVKWKITQETRNILGYECRKAIGRIYDTVYIVAFYCEQMVMKAGPEGISGLPGMILGMAIPRYNTTWFATKIELANINETEIVPPTKGKKLSDKELSDLVIKTFKQYGMKEKDMKTEMIEGMYKGYFL